MNMSEHSDKLRESLLRAAAMGDDHTQQVAAKLVDAVEPALHLQSFSIAAELADEINRLSSSVHVDVVMTPEGATLRLITVEMPSEGPPLEEPDTDETVRITLRIPKGLKTQVDSLAQAAGKSLNSWIVGTMRMGAARERSQSKHHATGTQSFVGSTLRGWVR